MTLPAVLRKLLALPTAPFAEAAVLDAVEQACRGLEGVHVGRDRHGNLLARYSRRPTGAPPLAFVAHTDHPGFVAQQMLDGQTLRAAFRGGVKPEYFAGAGVRFWSGGRWIRGRVQTLSKTTRVPDLVGWASKPEEALVHVRAPVPAGAPGMWDLRDPVLRGGRVWARGCDDLAGAAALVVLLQRLSRRRARGQVYCLFTRAEEVGFVGAIAAARSRTIPRRVPVLSIETSRALPHAPLGGGPILRVGDRAAVFDPALCAFCDRVARGLAERRRSFRYQRKLMDGGTCEAAPFLAYGYRAAGICVALGNYHNMDTQRGRIASECISLQDWQGMVALCEALVLDEQGCTAELRPVRARLDARFAHYAPLLGG